MGRHNCELFADRAIAAFGRTSPSDVIDPQNNKDLLSSEEGVIGSAGSLARTWRFVDNYPFWLSSIAA